jgi:hypothetical protein
MIGTPKLWPGPYRISKMTNSEKNQQNLSKARAALLELGTYSQAAVMKMNLAQLYAAIDLARLQAEEDEPVPTSEEKPN